jgi:TPR repeat protein
MLAKKMVEAASVLANEGGRADARTAKKNRENYIFDAHKIVKKLCNSSHPYPDAMFYLAECYWEGLLGLQVDHERAFNLYQSSAKLNHGPSAYRTAVCCELGAGVRKDPLKSITWYKKAAALGDTAAMYKLGMIQLKGLLGQTKNARDAINWLKRAADQADENNPHALHQLGLIYECESHDNIIPDASYSRELFMKAAELNYPPSQFRIGCAFEYGTMGCPIDPRLSIFWYSRAAAQNEEESALALSGWYLTGADGVIKQSDTEAYLWARKAAEKGLGNAEYALGYYTEVGIGVVANLDEAKKWYYKAANRNHEKARQRLNELKKGGAAVQKSREKLSRLHVKKNKDDGECVIM